MHIFQHLFQLQEYDELIKAVTAAAAAFIGISIRQRKDPITFEMFQDNRLGKFRYGQLFSFYFLLYEYNICVFDILLRWHSSTKGFSVFLIYP